VTSLATSPDLLNKNTMHKLKVYLNVNVSVSLVFLMANATLDRSVLQ